jgi:cell division transport system permease protein
LATVLTVAVMGLALALPLALNVLVRNVRGATGDFSDAVGTVGLLQARGQRSRRRASWRRERRRTRTGVASATLITAEQALAEFRAQSGFGAALDALPTTRCPMC